MSFRLKFFASCVLLAFFLLSCGCHRYQAPASEVRLADVTTSEQLTSGFYWLEGNAWRWTDRQFSVALRPPRNAAQRGARLRLRLYLPDSQIARLREVTLRANVNGLTLASESYTNSGAYEYVRPVPAAVMDTNLAPVHFCLDKSAPPTPPVENRQLGVVVSEIALIPNP
jgi:hypothetical protein